MVSPGTFCTLHLQYPKNRNHRIKFVKQNSEKHLSVLNGVSLRKNKTENLQTWNQKQLTNLLRINTGRIHKALNVQDMTAPIQIHTVVRVSEIHWAEQSQMVTVWRHWSARTDASLGLGLSTPNSNSTNPEHPLAILYSCK